MCVFLIAVPMFPLSLVKIGQILNKRQLFLEIQNGGGRHIDLWLLKIFQRHRCVLNPSSNISTKVDDYQSITNEVATVFQNQRWRRPPPYIFPIVHFRRHRYVPNRSPNVWTNFGDDQSNTKETAAAFRNPRLRRPPS